MAVALLAGLGGARAETSPWYLGVQQQFTHDSNVYRLVDGRSVADGRSKSDLISGTGLVAGIDQSIGRQRLYGSGYLRENRFSDNKNLNNRSYSLNLAWDWQTVNRLSGTVSVSADRSLAQFDERLVGGVLQFTPNVVTRNAVDARFQLGTVTRLTWEGGLGYRTQRYSAASYDRSEYDQSSASAGARYRLSGALNVGAALRLTDSTYPRYLTVLVLNQAGLVTGTQVLSDRQKRQDIDLTAVWQPTGASTVNIRLSPTRIRYDRNTGGDFSGVTGGMNWGWQLTGKTRIDTSLSRDSGQSSDAQLSVSADQIRSVDLSQVTTNLGVRASHQLTGKISLSAGLQVASRSLQRTDANGAVSTGSERPVIASLGARWQPLRSTQVGCDLSSESRRGSGAIGASLHYTSVGCSAQIVLQ